ncbi:mucin-associated surface protein (plasmid) [Massilia violaceinigra]|uniref:Mucin-associated surface protein n=1 Tax=Massilia violaceinigra TaxID=2045208 RepID=A0A2D2DW87_9BURK|nr:DNA-binding protein [Massilia violaceinigra]ATQ79260.1 mucin-associated surface protein [Massilia violaceinigra]
MGREASITLAQVAAIADAMVAAGTTPALRTVRERLGNMGSLGTISKLLQQWRADREKKIASALTLPAGVQRAILEFMGQELSSAKATLEIELAEQQQEAADLATENERQAAEIERQVDALTALQVDLATVQGKAGQLELDWQAGQVEMERERKAAESARTELAKAQLRLEAMPRLEADLVAVREELAVERTARVVAEQAAAVAAARFDASERRAGEIEAREQAAVSHITELERMAQQAARELASANLAVQASQARFESAARELEQARTLVAATRDESKRASEEAAELRGQVRADALAAQDAAKRVNEDEHRAKTPPSKK